jgi:hypothetical protein
LALAAVHEQLGHVVDVQAHLPGPAAGKILELKDERGR